MSYRTSVKVGQTWAISTQEVDNALHPRSGAASVFMPQVAAETSSAQLHDAYAYRRYLAKQHSGAPSPTGKKPTPKKR